MGGGMDFLNTVSGEWAWWMLQIGWQVTALAAVIWIIALIFRKSSASFRYVLWLLIFVRLLLPPTLATPWSAGTLVSRVAEQAVPGFQSGSPVQVGGLEIRSALPVRPKSGESGHGGPTWSPLTVGMGLWALVSATLLTLLGIQYRRYSRKLLRDLQGASAKLREALSAEAERLGIQRKVAIGLSAHIATPAVFGAWRPLILLPSDAETRFSEAYLRNLLAHELAHIQRNDIPMGWLVALLLCLYWFHPAVWLANLYLRREREMACDDLVLSNTPHREKEYAETIIQVAQRFQGGVPVGAGFLGLLEMADNLLHRVRSASDPTRPRRPGWGALTGIALTVFFVLPMAAWTPASVAQEPAKPAPAGQAQAEPTPQEPELVSTVPAIGAKDVDPTITEIRVRFDQDMAGGFSWTGGGDVYPKTTGKPYWLDPRTCILPVTLESGKYYRVGINSTSHQNFRSAGRTPARCRVLYFVTKGANAAEQAKVEAPHVVSMVPQNGANDVSPTLDVLTVTFDKSMGGGFSWTQHNENYPETVGPPSWNETRTICTLPVKLQPGRPYEVGLNSSHHINFQSEAGVPLEPVSWTFTTTGQK